MKWILELEESSMFISLLWQSHLSIFSVNFLIGGTIGILSYENSIESYADPYQAFLKRG
jgi:hypothetical protein